MSQLREPRRLVWHMGSYIGVVDFRTMYAYYIIYIMDYNGIWDHMGLSPYQYQWMMMVQLQAFLEKKQ